MSVISYPKIYTLGDKRAEAVLTPGVIISVTEKIDGSQFSFGKVDGVFRMYSKHKEITLDNDSDKMFNLAKDYIRNFVKKMPENTIFHCKA